jgi:hypothetical protein
MKLPSWLTRRSRRLPRRPAARRPVRLALEGLEDRCVPTTIQGTVLDANSNAGLPAWTVWLDVNHDRILNSGDVVTTTDANGHYFFDTTNVPPAVSSPPDSYDIVQLDLQAGSGGRWLNTTPTAAAVDRATTPDATVNFGVSFQPNVGVAPAGSESPVNVAATGAPLGTTSGANVSVSADAAGNYVVGWQNYATGMVYARIFNADGSARTGDILVGAGQTPTDSNPYYAMPEVATAGNGRFLVAWRGTQGINAQAFLADGTPVGSPATVLAFNANTRGGLGGAAADATGDFVVVYDVSTYSKSRGWSTPTLKAQRYTPSGSANGSAITVASPNLVNGSVVVGMAGPGNFVVAWDDVVGNRGGGSSPYVYAQQYTASGSKSGSLITLPSGSASPDVAMNANGGFVVTYALNGGRQAQVYNANGTPSGTAVAYASGAVGGNGVTLDGAGNVTLAWTDNPTDTYSRAGIWVRVLTAGGVLQPVTLANTTTQGTRQLPGVAATGTGSFVVAWQGYGAADPAGIYAQRFTPVPSAPAVAAPAVSGRTAVSPRPADAAPGTAAGDPVFRRAADLGLLQAFDLLLADQANDPLLPPSPRRRHSD